ncbi:hypothetical protein AMS62_20615 [Bacillus sp. FJAT-18019]|nr:hypothetical protein AMS62_20615 [Bacillus sp. FJAT-18019]
MKKIIVICLGIIILSNGIWSYMYFNKQNKSDMNTEVHLFTLDGSGKQWDVVGYKILISPHKILRGHAKLVFRGDPSEIDKSTYYSLQFKERINNEDEVVYTTAGSSNNGSVSILGDLTGTGAIASPYSDGEIIKDKTSFESTTMTITWNDNDGEIHTETIDLDVVNEITLDDE